MFTRLTAAAGCLMMAFCAIPAQANMTVYPMATSISAKEEATSLQVFSRSAKTQYVRTTVKHILHPGTPQEKEVPVGSTEGLVVSPAKFVLAAGGSRTVRIIGVDSPAKEQAWRVYFEPVSALDSDEPPQADKTRLSVSLVWGILVHQLPLSPAPVLARSADGKTLSNTGNQRVGITRVAPVSGCQPSCSWTAFPASIYPDEQRALPGGITSGALRVEYRLSDTRPVATVDLLPGNTTPLNTTTQ